MTYFVMGTGSRSMVTHPDAKEIYGILRDKILELHAAHPDLVLITGMAEGWDEAIATIGMRESIPYHVYLPNPGYGDYYWGRNSQLKRNRMEKFSELVDFATEVIVVCDSVYVNGVHSNFLRNDAMVNICDEALVYDTGSSGTKQAVGSLKIKCIPRQTFPFDTLPSVV